MHSPFPSKDEVSRIAMRDPRLAYALLSSPRQQLQVFTATAEFPSGSVAGGAPNPASLDQQLPEEVYVVDFAYQVTCPNANAGSLFKGQQDEFNALNPGINGRIVVTAGLGGWPYVVNQEFAPIEGLARHTSRDYGGICSWPNGWHIGYGSNVNIDLVLTRTYTETELPCRVTFFLYSQYLACCPKQLKMADAIAGLSGFGVSDDVRQMLLAKHAREGG